MGIARDDAKLSVGAGWAALVDEIYDHLPEGTEIFDVKEKWGRLRCEAVSTSDCPEGFFNLLAEIENRSAEVCEMCGQPGRPRTGGWIKTMCDGCAQKRKGVSC